MISVLCERIAFELCTAVRNAIVRQEGIRLAYEGEARSMTNSTYYRRPKTQLVGWNNNYKHVVIEVVYKDGPSEEFKKALAEWTSSPDGFDVAIGALLYMGGQERIKASTNLTNWQIIVQSRGTEQCEVFDVDIGNIRHANIQLRLPNLLNAAGEPVVVTFNPGEAFFMYVLTLENT